MLNMKTTDKEHKTKQIGFRVTPTNYKRLVKRFGTVANIRDYLLAILDIEGNNYDAKQKK